MAMKKVPKNKANFDPEEIQKLAALGCTQGTVAKWYGVTKRCIEINLQKNPALRTAWDKGAAAMEIGARQNLVALSKTNAAAAIFLCKNVAGMRDVVNTEMSGSVEITEGSAKERLLTLLDRVAAKRATEESDQSIN